MARDQNASLQGIGEMPVPRASESDNNVHSKLNFNEGDIATAAWALGAYCCKGFEAQAAWQPGRASASELGCI